MSTDFINCSSLFSRLVTKLAPEGQRQLSLPPMLCLCIFGTQTEINDKQKDISINSEKHESFFINMVKPKYFVKYLDLYF